MTEPCKHEPIEYVIATDPDGVVRYMQALTFSELQPPVSPGWPTYPSVAQKKATAGFLIPSAPQTTRYAIMGCRHCKAPFIDVVPPVRVVDPNTDPFRSEGG